jgi:ABC-2 type transport system permease protein
MDLRKVWIVARHEYVTSVRRPGFIIMTLAVPVLGLVILVAAAFFSGQLGQLGTQFEQYFDVGDQRIGVVDQSGYFSEILSEYRDGFTLYVSEGAAEQALAAEEIESILIIGEDYLETGQVVAVTPGSSFGAAVISDSVMVRAFLIDHLLTGRVGDALRQRVADPMEVVARTLSPDEDAGAGAPMSFVFTFVIPYVLAMFLIVTIFVSSGYLLQGVAEEKENRVVEIVVSSVRPVELMAGKVLGLGVLGLTQVLIWVGSALGFSSGSVALLATVGAVSIPFRMLALGIVYYILGYTLYAILMAGIGALGTTSRESQQLASIFSFFAAVPYMISGFLFTNPNALVARIFSFFPLTAPTMMMLRLPLAEVPWVDIVGSIALLILSIPVALWVGAKLFQVGLLIYGKRPTLREIWRIIRSP